VLGLLAAQQTEAMLGVDRAAGATPDQKPSEASQLLRLLAQINRVLVGKQGANGSNAIQDSATEPQRKTRLYTELSN
jgi:hypothetical protein